MNSEKEVEVTPSSGNIANAVLPAVFVGMKLYREVSHRNFPTEIKEYTVSKIGKKYFYVAESDRYAINKEKLKYEDKVYSQSSFQLYRSREEIEQRWEMNRLYDKVQKQFSHYTPRTVTLEQLRQIVQILGLS